MSRMQNKSSIVIELVWIAIGLLSFYLSVKEFLNLNNSQGWMFLGMAVVYFLLAWFRDKQRKKS